jgi:hypothetical protein
MYCELVRCLVCRDKQRVYRYGMFCYQNAGQNCNVKTPKQSLPNMAQLNHCGRSLEDKNIEQRNFGACLHISVTNLASAFH